MPWMSREQYQQVWKEMDHSTDVMTMATARIHELRAEVKALKEERDMWRRVAVGVMGVIQDDA